METKFDSSGWDVNELWKNGQTEFEGKLFGERYGQLGWTGQWANQPIQQAAWRNREGR